ncbi:MAG: T9SS type A sorting domain-containing protein [Bacteroidia bacterium]
MKKITLSLILLIGFTSFNAFAQTKIRFRNEVFTDAQIQAAKGLPFATNLNWLIIDQVDLKDTAKAKQTQVFQDITYLKTQIAMGNKFGMKLKYYLPKSSPGGDSTILKITTLKMDAYMPSMTADTSKKRPIIIYLHTGNFLPPGINGSPCGDKSDSIVVDMCKGWARRGFVAIAIDYRLGWNPISTSLAVRRGTLLNAVYRSIHDVQECVRVIKGMGAAYNMDINKIAIVGEGTGAYIAHAYNTLDKYPEFMALPKFAGAIDTATVGWLDGSRGKLNLYTKSSVSTKVQVIGTLGGALADTTWLEAGDAPTISMQCVLDPFAPFGYGTVIVPPPLNLDVVDVDGANNTIMRAQRLGNNALFAAIPSKDPYTTKARSLYNRTVSYILPAPADKITIRSGEGMYPFLLPKAAQFSNQASPYQWWDPTSKEGKYIIQAPDITAHMNGLSSNSDMSKAKSKLYQDTIHGFMTRRIAYAMGLLTVTDLGVTKTKVSGVKIYPNPATNSFSVSYPGMINSITVTDISGKIVYQAEVNSTSYTVSSLNLNQGLYLINISTNQGNAIEKLIIK